MATKLATPHCEPAVALLKALGLEGRSVTEVHIHLTADNVTTVDIVECVWEDALGEFVKQLASYKLTLAGLE